MVCLLHYTDVSCYFLLSEMHVHLEIYEILLVLHYQYLTWPGNDVVVCV